MLALPWQHRHEWKAKTEQFSSIFWQLPRISSLNWWIQSPYIILFTYPGNPVNHDEQRKVVKWTHFLSYTVVPCLPNEWVESCLSTNMVRISESDKQFPSQAWNCFRVEIKIVRLSSLHPARSWWVVCLYESGYTILMCVHDCLLLICVALQYSSQWLWQ